MRHGSGRYYCSNFAVPKLMAPGFSLSLSLSLFSPLFGQHKNRLDTHSPFFPNQSCIIRAFQSFIGLRVGSMSHLTECYFSVTGVEAVCVRLENSKKKRCLFLFYYCA
jgi:hypothetical protein